ncbi:MAG: putative porin [Dysgonamonadaceae bacterium]|nr:putative porin [Dysgonamonadaceae bacterium]MDD3356430.1 putative porin [Dysgonamonadaceae bacterium]MDD3728085.1 putative porin [Dysgonamonadaceae bacterium]MDD4606069.1 putative porin [Dysgonamonadaceae bacterium]HUI33695.1 putative porin [Dysgonamonadaceae bacterium]
MTFFYVSLHSMKEKLAILWLMGFFTLISVAQQPHIIVPDSSLITTERDSLDIIRREARMDEMNQVPTPQQTDSLKEPPRFTVWKIDERTGERYTATPDTVLYNYQQTTLPDGHSVVMGHLGNLGSPAISKLFFDRDERSQFIFYDAYYLYNKDVENQQFFNTRVPYSRINYQSAGGNIDKEERLETRFTMNFNRHFNFGFDLDFINAKGFYASQAAKQNNYTVYSNYLSDRIEAHAFIGQTSMTNFENGGITDSLFITNPELIEQNFSSRDIPTRMRNTWNRMKTNQFYLSARYNLGYNEPSLVPENKKFVPVASLIFTTRYKQQERRFLSYDTARVTLPDGNAAYAIDTLYRNNYYPSAVDDSTRYSTFKNTAALSMREGFRDWVKFGLTVFVEHETRNFDLLDTIGDGRYQYKEQATTIGGILSKQQGDFLRFNARADLGVLGANLGEFKAEADVETSVKIAGRLTTLTGQAYIKNIKPKFLEQQYHSKYFWWNNDFSDIRRVYVGGKLFFPITNTTLSAGVENIQNFIFFDKNKLPNQEGDNIQVVSARIDQNLKAGIFNWNNSVVYQTSTNEEVIPVPQLSAYSNIFLKTKIVNELTIQLGLDAHYHTKYYAPGYEPALLQFYNQRVKEIGNYPIVTGYLNMHLKQTRFFLMFYNIADYVMKPNYFSLPDYPVNPMLFKLGISVNLNN